MTSMDINDLHNCLKIFVKVILIILIAGIIVSVVYFF